MDRLVVLLLGGSAGGGLVYAFLKGTLAQMTAWKDVVEAKENHSASLIHDNAAQAKIIEEQRAVIDTAYVHLEACRKENEIANTRISQMNLEILDLKASMHDLQEQLRGKKSID